VLLRGVGMGRRFPAHWVEAAYRITDPRYAIEVRSCSIRQPAPMAASRSPPCTRWSPGPSRAGTWSAAASAIGWIARLACPTSVRPRPARCLARSVTNRVRCSTSAPRRSPTGCSAR
jgi:hypothetical protein